LLQLWRFQATRDAEIAKAEAIQARDEKVYETKIAIEQFTIDRDMQMESNKKEINTVKAIAENAERLKKAELDQNLVNEQLQIKLIERKGEAKVMDEEMKLQEKRLQATTLLDAETTKYKSEIKAEADRTQAILNAEANALTISHIGEAEAEATKIKSEAEAKTTALKAKAYEQFGKAALVGEVIKTLPKIAAEVAAPTRDMKKVTLVTSGEGHIGFKRITDEIINIMNEVPDGVNDITGIDLKGEIKRVMA
jgi:flotillin